MGTYDGDMDVAGAFAFHSLESDGLGALEFALLGFALVMKISWNRKGLSLVAVCTARSVCTAAGVRGMLIKRDAEKRAML